MANAEIILMLQEFISGADRSLALANRIEVWLDDSFPEDEHLQETVETLACYRPDGDDSVLGAGAVTERLKKTLDYLVRAGVGC